MTRVYVCVESAARTVAQARKQGVLIAIDSMALGGHGTIAIFIQAGVEHAIWQLPS